MYTNTIYLTAKRAYVSRYKIVRFNRVNIDFYYIFFFLFSVHDVDAREYCKRQNETVVVCIYYNPEIRNKKKGNEYSIKNRFTEDKS